MKIGTAAAAVAVAAAVAGMAQARNAGVPPAGAINVCVETMSNPTFLSQAKGMASAMFATAGVAINWRPWNHCPADAIRIFVSEETKASDHPGALAYALPYEGNHIVLFRDRLAVAADDRAQPYLLAHVLVHEITHILEGVVRHSKTGVMKAQFTLRDIGDMESHPLPFAAEDVVLIHRGIEARNTRLLAGKVKPGVQRTGGVLDGADPELRREACSGCVPGATETRTRSKN